ncbi:hypothetical protein [Zoogloea sp.]|jgi:hypothetical protein|uniref:hypothetical protein n=1 Tax=Zoogloea sp. TaxID=49181 RepID=UPI0037D9A24F
MIRRANDTLTGDLFEVPVPKAALPGALNFGIALRHVLCDVLKAAPLGRAEIAARMSELIGEPVSKRQLDAWTAESRNWNEETHQAWRFPLEYLPALEVACETHALTAWVVDLRGGKLLVGKEALDAEIGRLERTRDEATKRIKSLKQQMGEAD